MKKGFTLIELLGVIVILAILTTIVVPVATTLISKSTSQLNQVQLKNIQTGAISWAADNVSSIPGDGSKYNAIQVSLTTLINGGYIPSDIKDLTTKNTYNGTIYVVIMYDNKRLVYDVYNNSTILLFDSNHSSQYSYVSHNSTCYKYDSKATSKDATPIPSIYSSSSKECTFDAVNILYVAG